MKYIKNVYFLIIFIVFLFSINYLLFSKRKIEYFQQLHKISDLDSILYINLKNRKDRNKQIQNELKKLNISNDKIHRIDAIYDKKNGHLGCVKSHIKALEFAKKHNFKNTLILEDDFIFTKPLNEINKSFNIFFNKFKNNWDVLMLKCSHYKLKNIHKFKNKGFKKVINTTGAMSYIVNKPYYDIIINNLKESKNKMEEEMENYDYNKLGKKLETNYAFDQHWQKIQNRDHWYIFYPFIGDTKGSSSIMNKNLEQFRNNYEYFDNKLKPIIYV